MNGKSSSGEIKLSDQLKNTGDDIISILEILEDGSELKQGLEIIASSLR
ncbi:MAG: hypothetical protein U5O15_00730 [Candidatus Krumholzibacteriota bacterium]|nr:hypothetical protein [Candidatus Krumholzibacteriota bacterium]